MDYTVTFKGEDYCYGDGIHQLPTPSGPFTYGWSSCCWVGFTTDNGGYVRGDDMQQIAVIYDTTNTSPSFKHPPLWLIMAGCDGQKIDLAPTDADGDQVRCRWATFDEASGAFTDLSLWPSLSLDEANCVVHYTGSMDGSSVGVKPVALMMEDFDQFGNIRSSIPVQFLARVWTPDLQSRSVGVRNYPKWFADDDHDDSDKAHSDRQTINSHKKVLRGRRSTPLHCTSVPVFIGSTPSDGDILDASSGSVSFVLQAASQIGTISSFTYQGPLGLGCTDVDQNGSVTCTWSPTATQVSSLDFLLRI